MLVDWFDSDMIAGPIRSGLAMARRENMKAVAAAPPRTVSGMPTPQTPRPLAN